MSSNTLLVLDFDWTVINSNSDTDVIENFAANVDECKARLREAGKSDAWTAGMDAEMELLHKNGTTVEQMQDFLMSIKIERELSDSLKLACASGATIKILSDANTWFIDVILKANGLPRTIACVCSNPAEFEPSGRVRVRPFHTNAHPQGSTSPPNLCKGRVMEEWLSAEEGKIGMVVYAGDGGGDFEGAMRVPQGGIILARKNWSLHKRLSAAAELGNGPKAEVRTWETQVQLAAILFDVLGLSSTNLGH